MQPLLWGDHHWWPEFEQEIGRSIARLAISEEASQLLHGYKRALQPGVGLLRTPTLHANASYLTPLGLGDRLEAIHNLAVTSGLEAAQKSGQDPVLAGCMGPHRTEGEGLAPFELQQIFGEQAIYLIDRGVHSLHVEGFTQFDTFRLCLETIKRVNHYALPVSAFFRPSSLTDMTLLKQISLLAETLEVELLGLELRLEQVHLLPSPLPWGELALGFALMPSPGLDQAGQSRALAQLLEHEPALLLGGPGYQSQAWNSFHQLFLDLFA